MFLKPVVANLCGHASYEGAAHSSETLAYQAHPVPGIGPNEVPDVRECREAAEKAA